MNYEKLFNIINKQPLPNTTVAYTKEQNGFIYFYNNQNKMITLMTGRDWLDIVHDKPGIK